MLFIDSSGEGHYAPGKNQNKLREEDIKKIVDMHRDFAKGKFSTGVVEDKFSFVATPRDLDENEYNLNIPRYVDTFEPEPEVDIAAVQVKIKKLEVELVEVEKEMAGYLRELGYINK